MSAFSDLPLQFDPNTIDKIQQEYISMQKNENSILKDDPHDIVVSVIKSLNLALDEIADPIILHDILVRNAVLITLVVERLY